MSEKIRPISPEKIEAEITEIARLKAEREVGSAEHFQRELIHEVKAQKRVNLKEVLQNEP